MRSIVPRINRRWNNYDLHWLKIIVDLTFRITTCRSRLAIAFRTWDLVCINLSFASKNPTLVHQTGTTIVEKHIRKLWWDNTFHNSSFNNEKIFNYTFCSWFDFFLDVISSSTDALTWPENCRPTQIVPHLEKHSMEQVVYTKYKYKLMDSFRMRIVWFQPKQGSDIIFWK